MKSAAQIDQIQISSSVSISEKFRKHFFSPVAAGLRGFLMILTIIFSIHLFLYVIRLNNKLVMDYVDLLLAGFGFMLRFSSELIKTFM